MIENNSSNEVKATGVDIDNLVEKNKGTDVLPSWTRKVANTLRLIARFMPSTVAKFMAKMWFKPYMSKQKQHVIDWQDKADQEILLSKGQAFLFSTGGEDEHGASADKPLAVCIHGWRGRGHQMRRFVDPLLERGFRVVMVNLPGHCDKDDNRTHLYECADIIKQLAQKVGPIDTIIAHSFGSPVTALALNEKMQLRKVVFIAGNFNIRHLLTQYALAFDLEYLVPKIEQHLQTMCDELIFQGAWDSLKVDVVTKNLLHAEDVQFWHDPQDTEISIPTNNQIHQFLKEKNRATSINEVANLGHFDILKSDDVVERICDRLI